MKICMLVSYFINYVWIYFHIFLKLVNMTFDFLENNEITDAREPKTLSMQIIPT
jgi:hypothetical protein